MASGPIPKLHRQRADRSKVVGRLAADGEVRGFNLPADALAEGETWHPMVVVWWEAFRRSPQARLVTSEMQWHTLVMAMRIYQDLWRGPERGRAVRAAEIRQIFTLFLVTPGDARRHGIEFVHPEDPENPDLSQPSDNVSNLAERRRRLLEE